jgi:biotin synthase
MTPTLDHARELYDLPLTELMFRAQQTHRLHHDPAAVQLCTRGWKRNP